MRVTCPTCDTGYTIPDAKIGAAGRDVRCTRCATKWFVSLPADPPAPLPDPAVSFADGDDDPFPEAAAAQDAAEVRNPPEPVREAGVLPGIETQAEPARLPAADHRPATDAPKVDIETLAKPRVRVAPRKSPNLVMLVRKHLWRARGLLFRARLPIGLTIFVVALLLPVCGIVLRATVVRHVPQLAGLYREIGLPVNLRGLDFAGLKTLRELDNGQPVLVVEGAIANVTRAAVSVPTVRLALRGADGQEIYAWSVEPKAVTVPAGDTVRFRSRLASPPDDAVDVQLRFLERKTRQASHP